MTRYFKCFSITLVFAIVSISALLFFWPPPALLGDINFSKAIYDDHHRLLRITLSADAKYRLLVPLSAIPPQLISATLLQEDQYFYWHLGVNPVSILKAASQTYLMRSRRLGASTITMQVARLRYHINSKTLSGKIWQIIRALQLEIHYSKKQILEAYFNLAPYGSNIEGVGAVSLIYFNKPVHDLNLPEVLTLAVIPQNPNKRTPNQIELKTIRNKFYLRWLAKHPQDKNQQSLMDLPLQLRSIHKIPFLAPHFVNEVLLQSPNQNEIITTLNIPLQNTIQKITQHYLARKKILGVNNAAVMLIDVRNMNVKALLGSADFFNRTIGGQINGTEIKRSPGSTLKPFIYALAIDQGLIHPATVLKDVPRSFGSYNPENFDNDFVGPINATNALILSRNIPAVFLADQLKHPNLYEFLQASGINDLKPESYYGLALVLGGAEISMQDLVTLYAMLANQGTWKPLKFMPNHFNLKTTQHLLSPEACYLVLSMLQETNPPGFEYSLSASSLPIAWKTGTSSGFRDAWCIGVIGNYVLAVWIGNFDNQSNQAFIGKDIAAPLFFEIIHSIKNQIDLKTERTNRNLNLVKVDVCKASGMLPTRHCHDRQETWFIPGKSPIKTDMIHREIAINSVTGLRACHFDEKTRFEVYEFWPSDLLKIFRRAGIQRRTPPPYDLDCFLNNKKTAGLAPQILSPQTTVRYITRIHSSNDTLIPFTAVVDADVTKLYWFINETYLGNTSRDQAFLWHAHPGKFIVRVVDDYGRSDARDLQVSADS